jgi:uncharacterized protein YacL
MPRRWMFFVRLIGGVLFAVAGYYSGSVVYSQIVTSGLFSQGVLATLFARGILTSASLALFGFAFGYLLTPTLIRPLQAAYGEIREVPPVNLLGGTIGLAIGLLLSALMTIPLSTLPAPFGQLLPFVVAVALGYLGAATIGNNPEAYLGSLPIIRDTAGHGRGSRYILLDTSVIIDGRVSDVAETGFLEGTLLVPRFVLNELQQIADSPDSLRRNRGRRGLEILNRLQQSTVVRVELSDADVTGIEDVDRKLLRLAEELKCPIMTNDYNLNRVAEIQSIRVLNLNELANAVKTLLLPGEQLDIRIIQEGKEHGQGVGYLDDGTMVVVEQGREHLNSIMPVTVTRVLQTVAGRMIFATPAHGGN